MGRPSKHKTRAEKEIVRILSDSRLKDYLADFTISFEPFRWIISEPKHFEPWLESLEMFKKHKGKILVGGKPRYITKKESGILNAISVIQKHIRNRLKCPIHNIAIKILETTLFQVLVPYKHLGISYKINREEEDYGYATIFIEPGAKTSDLRKFVDNFGVRIINCIESYLPEKSHLRGIMGKKTYTKRDELVCNFRKNGLNYKQIQYEMSQRGYDILMDHLRQIVRASRVKKSS